MNKPKTQPTPPEPQKMSALDVFVKDMNELHGGFQSVQNAVNMSGGVTVPHDMRLAWIEQLLGKAAATLGPLSAALVEMKVELDLLRDRVTELENPVFDPSTDPMVAAKAD